MKKKSIYVNYSWVGYLLIGMGLAFFIPAFIMQVVSFGPENFNFTVNGVRQPYTVENLLMFRRIFLFAFGTPATILVLIGSVIFVLQRRKKKRMEELKQEGQMIVCQNLEIGYSAIQVNHQYQMLLNCSYTDQKGDTYLFKSRTLRYDPRPYLNGQVNVYHERENIKNYVVDVEGSMSNVYEV